MLGVVGEGEAPVVEGNEARFGDGARGEFLAGAGGTGDQRGEFAHPRVKSAPVAAHIVREDGLPDRAAKAGGRERAADDVPKGDVEGALDLPETGEGVPRIAFRRETDAFHVEVMAPVSKEFVVEAPAGRVLLLRPETGLVELGIGALIDQVERSVLVELKVRPERLRTGSQETAQVLNQRLEFGQNAPHVRARSRMLGAVAPHGLAFEELVAEYGPLAFDPFGQKRIGVAEPRYALEECALRRGDESH